MYNVHVCVDSRYGTISEATPGLPSMGVLQVAMSLLLLELTVCKEKFVYHSTKST